MRAAHTEEFVSHCTETIIRAVIHSDYTAFCTAWGHISYWGDHTSPVHYQNLFSLRANQIGDAETSSLDKECYV